MSKKRNNCWGVLALLALIGLASACQRQMTLQERQRRAIDLVGQADAYFQEGEIYQARDLYHKADDWWSLPKAYEGLGNCYLQMEEYAKAAYFFRQASAASPNNALFASMAQYAAALASGKEATAPLIS